MYTNLESISLGCVTFLSSFQKGSRVAKETIEDFKKHPLIQRIIADTEIVEYSANLIPEGGYNSLSNLFDNGIMVVGDAAGLLLNTGYSYEGMNYAIASGIAAAKTAKLAIDRQDNTKMTLKIYKELLERSFVLPSLRNFRNIPELMHNQRIYTNYASVLNELGKKLFTSNLRRRQKLLPTMFETTLSNLSLADLVRDAVKMGRSI
jgi:electron transfer flavoprotein-quinone oxidoreductase